MAYSVSQRTRELGIRISVGAKRRDIFKLILGQGLALSIVGLLGGLVAALAVTRLTANLLYGVSATDPVTFIVIAVLLLRLFLGIDFRFSRAKGATHEALLFLIAAFCRRGQSLSC